KAIKRPWVSASSVSPISTPTVRMRAAGCAFARIGRLMSAPPSNVMNSRRLMGLTQGQRSGGKYSMSDPCIAAKADRSSLVRVISVGDDNGRASTDVWSPPKADENYVALRDGEPDRLGGGVKLDIGNPVALEPT